MSDTIEFLVLLGFVLFLVALIGHGLWLLGAAILRLLSGNVFSTHRPGLRCPSCGAAQGVVDGRCRICGATPQIRPSDSTRSDIEAALRQLARLQRQGAITQLLHDDLCRLLRDQHARPTVESPLGDAATPIGAKPSDAAAAETPVGVDTEEEEVIDQPETVGASAAEQPPTQDQAPIAEEPRQEVVEAEIVEREPVWVAPQPPEPQLAAATPLRAERPTASHALSDILHAFMEEKNIRWGEIISGLLIVVSAVGLVISLWSTLQKSIPYLPALIFMLGTAAFHGAGIYTLRRWKLRQVSRAVLIIGLLLVPLNFLAAIALTGGDSEQARVSTSTYAIAVIVGLTGYGLITFFASRELLADGWWTVVLAVMGTSAGQLIINRQARPEMSFMGVTILMTLPLASYLVATLGQIWRSRRWKRLSPRRSETLLLVLSIGTFSLLAPAGLLVSKTDSIRGTLSLMSPSLSLAAAAILAAGLFVHQRTTSAKLAVLRMWGTAVAIWGVFLMLVMFLLAWPQPNLLIAVGLVNAVLLACLAMVAELPVLHAGAIVCLAIAYLVGFHLLRHSLDVPADQLGRRIVNMVFTGVSSVALTVLAALVAGLGGGLRGIGRRADALVIWASAAALGALSVLIAACVGFFRGPEADLATPVFALYAALLFIAAPFVRRPAASWTGAGLLLAALLHGLVLNETLQNWLARWSLAPARPALVALLLHANLCALLAGVVAWRVRRRPLEQRSGWPAVVDPVSLFALLSSVLAVPAAVWVRNGQFGAHAIYTLFIATAWLGVAVIRMWPALLTAIQAMATVCVSFVVVRACQEQPWWSGQLLDLRHVQSQLSVLALWCAAWCVGRRLTRRVQRIQQLVPKDGAIVDRVVLGGVIVGIVGTSFYGCWFGLIAELGMTEEVSDNPLAYGGAAWIAMLSVAVAVCASLWERPSLDGLVGLIVAGSAVPLLVAGPFETEMASASALRWSFALFGLCLAVPLCLRGALGTLARRIGLVEWENLRPGSVAELRSLALTFSAMPVLVITTLALFQVAAGRSLGGPTVGSLFYRMGPAWSYATPLAVLVSTFLAYAIRERSPWLAMASSVVLQYFVSLAFLLPVLSAGQAVDWPVAAELLQRSAIGLGGFTLVWRLLARWIEPEGGSVRPAFPAFKSPLGVQVQLMLAAIVALAIWAAVGVIVRPAGVSAATRQLGDLPSYLATLLAAVAFVWCFRGRLLTWSPHWVGTFACVSVALIAASTSVYSSAQNWFAYHVLMAGWLGVATLATTAACWITFRARLGAFAAVEPHVTRDEGWTAIGAPSVRWATALGLVLVLLAFGACGSDPARPWWSTSTTIIVAALAGALALAGRSQPFAYASTCLAAIATTLFWIGGWPSSNLQAVIDLIQLNLLAATLTAGVWLVAEIRSQRRFDRPFDATFRAIPVHRLVAVLTTAVLALEVAGGLTVATLAGRSAVAVLSDVGTVVRWCVLVALAALITGTLWDRTSRHGVAGLYVWGLVALGMLIDALRLDQRTTFFAVGLAAAGYVAWTGLVWQRGALWSLWAVRLGVSDPVAGLRATERWLPGANLLLATLATLAGLVVVLTFAENRPLRIGAGFCPALLAIGMAALAQKQRRWQMQFLTLLLAGLAGVYLGWADMEPSTEGLSWLARLIRLLIVLCAVAFVYSVVVARRLSAANDWNSPVRLAAATSGGAALATLVAVLLLETALFINDPLVGVPIDVAQLAAVSVVLVGLVVALIVLAVLPGRDPLALSERGRMIYVYGAQAAAALLFAHIYLARPEWFSQYLRVYWPYIVMVIAFFGVAVGELFQRLGLRVLAEPFQRTGSFLPLLPALGMWVIGSQSDYSLLLFFAGLLYMGLSIARKSLASGIAAAVAGNAAIWSLLHDLDFEIMQQPQVWLIPPALSVLVAAELNRGRLSSDVLTGLRYSCMLVIYVSSTGEMFIRGVGQDIWPPMLLLGLAVAGAFAGILLRIRAFLYLGTTFVFLAIISMVWHASRAIEHVWPWWAFGIGLGLCILIMFGIFEKKRDQVMQLADHLRQWER